MAKEKKKKTKYYPTPRYIYLDYPYKTKNLESNTVELPYFPKSEMSDHKYKMSYGEWRDLSKIYLNVLFEYLLTGNSFKIPNGMGIFRLMKYRSKGSRKTINWKETKERWRKLRPEEKRIPIYFPKTNPHRYRPVFMWIRNHKLGTGFRRRFFWKFRLSQKRNVELRDIIENDSTFFYKLIES